MRIWGTEYGRGVERKWSSRILPRVFFCFVLFFSVGVSVSLSVQGLTGTAPSPLLTFKNLLKSCQKYQALL